jgi:cytoskeleton protein RodZ
MTDADETPGRLLAAERMRQNLSLADVSRQLRISERQLSALENDRYDELPGPVFVRGFIRNYARLLKVDPEPLIAAILPPPAPVAETPPPPRKNRTWLYVFAAIAVALAFAMHYLARQDFGEATMQVQMNAPKPVVVPPPPVPVAEQRVEAPAQTLQDDIKLVFKRESYVEIRDVTGKLLTKKSNPAGSVQTVVGEPPYSMVIGNAEHVEMTYQGENIDLAPHTKGGVARFILN